MRALYIPFEGLSRAIISSFPTKNQGLFQGLGGLGFKERPIKATR